MKTFVILFFATIYSAQTPVAFAHCPLCTIGAGAAALGASWLGISSLSIGVFIGAFAIALGLWIAKFIPKKYFIHQTLVIGILSFLSTVIPLQHLFFDNFPLMISISGDYGTWLNTVYYFDKFLIGSIIGAFIIALSPFLSKKISTFRNGKMIPYQGMILTLSLLLFFSFLAEIIQ
jgi:hypothetical protein